MTQLVASYQLKIENLIDASHFCTARVHALDSSYVGDTTYMCCGRSIRLVCEAAVAQCRLKDDVRVIDGYLIYMSDRRSDVAQPAQNY